MKNPKITFTVILSTLASVSICLANSPPQAGTYQCTANRTFLEAKETTADYFYATVRNPSDQISVVLKPWGKEMTLSGQITFGGENKIHSPAGAEYGFEPMARLSSFKELQTAAFVDFKKDGIYRNNPHLEISEDLSDRNSRHEMKLKMYYLKGDSHWERLYRCQE